MIEEHNPLPDSMIELSSLQKVTTDCISFINIEREMHVYSGTQNWSQRNILNERDCGCSKRHANGEEAETELESISYINRANNHEEYVSGIRMSQGQKTLVVR